MDDDLVAGLPAGDALADLPDDPRGVGAADVVAVLGVVAVAEDRDRLAERRPDVVEVDARRHHAHDHLEGAGLGDLDLLDLEGVLGLALALLADHPGGHRLGQLARLHVQLRHVGDVYGHGSPESGVRNRARPHPIAVRFVVRARDYFRESTWKLPRNQQLPLDAAGRRSRARRQDRDREPHGHRRAGRARRARARRGGAARTATRSPTRSRSARGCSTARTRRPRSTTCGPSSSARRGSSASASPRRSRPATAARGADHTELRRRARRVGAEGDRGAARGRARRAARGADRSCSRPRRAPTRSSTSRTRWSGSTSELERAPAGGGRGEPARIDELTKQVVELKKEREADERVAEAEEAGTRKGPHLRGARPRRARGARGRAGRRPPRRRRVVGGRREEGRHRGRARRLRRPRARDGRLRGQEQQAVEERRLERAERRDGRARRRLRRPRGRRRRQGPLGPRGADRVPGQQDDRRRRPRRPGPAGARARLPLRPRPRPRGAAQRASRSTPRECATPPRRRTRASRPPTRSASR